MKVTWHRESDSRALFMRTEIIRHLTVISQASINHSAAVRYGRLGKLIEVELLSSPPGCQGQEMHMGHVF